MASPRGIIQKLFFFREKNLDVQIDNIVRASNLFPFLGVIDSDPDTTGWGVKDICWWINNDTDTACLIKFWDGDEIKTVSTA